MKGTALLLAGLATSALLVVTCGGGQPLPEQPKTESKPAEPTVQPAAKAAAEKAPAATIVWHLPSIFNQSDYQFAVLQKFTAQVKDKSQGRLEIRHYGSSSLYGVFDIAPAMIDRRVEIGSLPTFGTSDSKPQLAVADLPYTSSNEAEGRKVVEALQPYFKRELDKAGLVYLMALPWPAQNLFTVKSPVKTAQDWKGKKIRSYSIESADFVRAMGAAAVVIPSADLRVGLQRGLAEGAVTSTMFIRSTKTYDVVKYANLWSWNSSPTELLAVNKKKWEELPADLRKILADVVAEEKLQEQVWELHRNANAEALKAITDQGVQRVDIDPAEIQKAKDISKRTVWQNWLKRAGAAGEEALKIAEQAVR